jgi:hypothetical protein
MNYQKLYRRSRHQFLVSILVFFACVGVGVWSIRASQSDSAWVILASPGLVLALVGLIHAVARFRDGIAYFRQASAAENREFYAMVRPKF